MKINFLVKLIPFLSTLIVIIFLNISNQKVNTKLRLLIWDTPPYSLGTYITIAAGSGFFLSYLVTTNLANRSSLKSTKSLKYKKENKKNYEYQDENFNNYSEKNLIEREITDPSPTINAQFRVIGKVERDNTNYIDHGNINYNKSNEHEYPYDEQVERRYNYNGEKDLSSDWDDDSLEKW